MNNFKISLIALAAVTALTSISVLLKTEKGKQKTDKWRKNRREYLAVAHDICEAFSEEAEGLRNRLFSGHSNNRIYVSSQQKAAV